MRRDYAPLRILIRETRSPRRKRNLLPLVSRHIHRLIRYYARAGGLCGFRISCIPPFSPFFSLFTSFSSSSSSCSSFSSFPTPTLDHSDFLDSRSCRAQCTEREHHSSPPPEVIVFYQQCKMRNCSSSMQRFRSEDEFRSIGIQNNAQYPTSGVVSRCNFTVDTPFRCAPRRALPPCHILVHM